MSDVESGGQPGICVIGGTGRSGTSVLSRVFDNHPSVARMPELRFLVDPDGVLDFLAGSGPWSPYGHEVRVRRLRSLLQEVETKSALALPLAVAARSRVGTRLPIRIQPRYGTVGAAEHIPGFADHVDQLMEDLSSFEYRGEWMGMPRFARRIMPYPAYRQNHELNEIFGRFLRNTIGAAVARQSASHYLEKNTWNILWFDQLRRVLPQARLVHIVREPRDTIASLMRQNWAPADLTQCAQFYLDLHARWQEVRAAVPVESVLEVRLEDLVEDPPTVLRSICEHWGLPWNDAVLDVDLSRSNSGRWRSEIAAEHHDHVTQAVAEISERYGYPE